MDFFIFIGSRWRLNLIASFSLHCPTCDRNTIQVYEENVQKLTLFMIPTITLARKPFVQCAECRILRQVSSEQVEEVRSRALQGAPPFRICPKCGARNELESVLCQVCDEQLQPTIFPRKGGARIMAILLTLVFAGMLLLFCVAIYYGL